MVFNCRQCGSCCMYLGDYITIERQTGEFTFDCECVSTGTEFTAEVDEDKRRIFSDYSFMEAHPTACRFLRPDGDLVRCVVMRVSDTSGRLLGTVRGTLDLHSDDVKLRARWEDVVRMRPKDDKEAEDWIAAFLREFGYRVD